MTQLMVWRKQSEVGLVGSNSYGLFLLNTKNARREYRRVVVLKLGCSFRLALFFSPDGDVTELAAQNDQKCVHQAVV